MIDTNCFGTFSKASSVGVTNQDADSYYLYCAGPNSAFTNLENRENVSDITQSVSFNSTSLPLKPLIFPVDFGRKTRPTKLQLHRSCVPVHARKCKITALSSEERSSRLCPCERSHFEPQLYGRFIDLLCCRQRRVQISERCRHGLQLFPDAARRYALKSR